MALKGLPLGVDIGSARLRIVATVLTEDGPRVRAVATRDLSEGVATSACVADVAYLGAAIEEAWSELQVGERRCVLSIAEPEATLHVIEFPKMSAAEREKAAAFEVRRHIPYPVEEAIIRIHPVDEKGNLYAVGTVRAAALRSRVQAARCGGLRVVAVDSEVLAFARALPQVDAVIDIGLERTAVHLFSGMAPRSVYHHAGGAEITRGIERDLTIDTRAAEKRKRILGTVGAGESTRSAYVAGVTALLEGAMVRNHPISRIALCGNGSRLNNFSVELERATGLLVDTAVSPIMYGSPYPGDVVKAGAPDWNLAAGLSLWGSTA